MIEDLQRWQEGPSPPEAHPEASGGGRSSYGDEPFNYSAGTALEQAIDAATDDPRLRRAMRLAAVLEGGNLEGNWGVGDEGYSFGPFQIYSKVHNVTRQQAEDPTFAVNYMLPEFQRGLARLDRENPGLWEADPMRAAMLIAGHAERPALWGQNPQQPYQADRVLHAWNQVEQRRVAASPPIATPTTAQTGIVARRTAAGGVELGDLTPNQFSSGLSSTDAYSACGPAAAIAFAKATGRNPTLQEAVTLARQVGWDPQRGMAGPASQVQLLQRMGMRAHLEQGVDWQRVAQEVMAGRPVIIDTPQHYWVVEGYDPATNTFNFGNSARVMRSTQGNTRFTPEQWTRLYGRGRGSIYLS